MSFGDIAHWAAKMVWISKPNSWFAGPTLWAAHSGFKTSIGVDKIQEFLCELQREKPT